LHFAVAGIQRSRQARSYRFCVWEENSGMPGRPRGSELAHDGAGMFAGETPESRPSSFVLDTVLATPRILGGARLPAIWRAAAAESDDAVCRADCMAGLYDDCVADRGTSHAPTGSASSFREQARPVRCLARDHGLPQCPCGSELAHDGARTSAALSVAGMQSSRLAPTGFVCGHRMSRRRFSGGSELAHEEVRTSAALSVAGI